MSLTKYLEYFSSSYTDTILQVTLVSGSTILFTKA